jgi:hypothetical protein
VEDRCETATFRLDDAESLVAASLACSCCLSSEVEWSLRVAGYEAWADCSCRPCGHERRVFLDGGQALRLSLHEARPLDPTPRPEELEAVPL